MQQKYTDYYQVLGIPRSANDKEIKAAYRKLARKYHPDVNPGDKAAEAKFKQISEANDILSDPTKRAAYDQWGDQWKAASQAQRPSSAGPNPFGGFRTSTAGFPPGGGFGPGGPGNLEDLLRTLFGDSTFKGAESSYGPAFHPESEPRNQEIEMTLDLSDAFHGAQRTIEFRSQPKRFRLDGLGTKEDRRTVDVRIPPGIGDGQRVRVAGRGTDGADLYVTVRIAPHPRFERRGDDLTVEVSLPFTKAALGGDVKVPTLAGNEVAVRVPAGTQSGQALRISGAGMPKLKGGGSGDLYVKLRIAVPKQLTDRQRTLLTEFAALNEES